MASLPLFLLLIISFLKQNWNSIFPLMISDCEAWKKKSWHWIASKLSYVSNWHHHKPCCSNLPLNSSMSETFLHHKSNLMKKMDGAKSSHFNGYLCATYAAEAPIIMLSFDEGAPDGFLTLFIALPYHHQNTSRYQAKMMVEQLMVVCSVMPRVSVLAPLMIPNCNLSPPIFAL